MTVQTIQYHEMMRHRHQPSTRCLGVMDGVPQLSYVTHLSLHYDKNYRRAFVSSTQIRRCEKRLLGQFLGCCGGQIKDPIKNPLYITRVWY